MGLWEVIHLVDHFRETIRAYLNPFAWKTIYRRVFLLTLPISFPALALCFLLYYAVFLPLTLLFGIILLIGCIYISIKNFWNGPTEEKESILGED